MQTCFKGGTPRPFFQLLHQLHKPFILLPGVTFILFVGSGKMGKEPLDFQVRELTDPGNKICPLLGSNTYPSHTRFHFNVDQGLFTPFGSSPFDSFRQLQGTNRLGYIQFHQFILLQPAAAL